MFQFLDRRTGGNTWRTFGTRAAIATPALAVVLMSAAEVTSVTLSPLTIASGGSSTGTVTVTGMPAGGLINLTLSSSNTAIATVPSTTSVSSKTNTGTFTVRGIAGAAGCPVISARLGTSPSKFQMLYVTPPAATGLLRVSVPANGTAGGATVNGSLTWMAAPGAGGIVVNLSSNTPNATVPATVTIPASAVNEVGVAVVSFPIHTSVVAPSTCAVITGTSGNATARALLKIATISG